MSDRESSGSHRARKRLATAAELQTRPAKRWADPIDLEDGRCAVPWREDRLAAIEGREVTVRGERLRVPRAQDVSEIEIATDEKGEPLVRDGRPVLREKIKREAV